MANLLAVCRSSSVPGSKNRALPRRAASFFTSFLASRNLCRGRRRTARLVVANRQLNRLPFRRHPDDRSGRHLVIRGRPRLHLRVAGWHLHLHRDGQRRQRHSPTHSIGPRRSVSCHRIAVRSCRPCVRWRDAAAGEQPNFLQVDQFITAEQAGIDILQRDGIITNNQANKLQSFFQRELQTLGSKALSSDLLSVKQIDKLMGLQADTAAYVAKTPALVAMQPNDAGWTMHVIPTS